MLSKLRPSGHGQFDRLWDDDLSRLVDSNVRTFSLHDIPVPKVPPRHRAKSDGEDRVDLTAGPRIWGVGLPQRGPNRSLRQNRWCRHQWCNCDQRHVAIRRGQLQRCHVIEIRILGG